MGLKVPGDDQSHLLQRSVCVYVCVVIPFILDVSPVDAPAGVTQEEGHIGFIARRIQPSLSLVDHEVEFCVPTD